MPNAPSSLIAGPGTKSVGPAGISISEVASCPAFAFAGLLLFTNSDARSKASISENKTAVLKEASRILRPNGRLAVIDWRESPLGGGWRMGPQKADVVTREAAEALAREAGFELEREFSAGAHHYGLIFRPASQRKP